jgi:hypothetical protein
MSAVRIDFSYDVLSPRSESVLSPDLRIEGAPPWLSISQHRRGDAPERFSIPLEIAAELEAEDLETLNAMPLLYSVHLTPGERPDEDAHIQYGIQLAAQIARAAGGIVLDRLAGRLLAPDEFEKTCRPGTEYHLSYAVGPGATLSRGMAKFGFPEVALASAGIDPIHAETLVRIVDAICAGVTAGMFQAGAGFELAGASWRLDEEDGTLMARPSGATLAEVVDQLAEGADE